MSFARHAVKCCARARARALCRPLCLGPSPGADSVEGVEVQPSELRTQVLGGYRRLMLARTELFAGDDYALQQSRLQLKAEFSDYTNRDWNGRRSKRRPPPSAAMGQCGPLCRASQAASR